MASAAIHNLYRCFDKNDNLLYVGISLRAGQRFDQHRRHSPWWGDVTTIKLEVYPTRRDAQFAEFRAIKLENPRFNATISRFFATRPGELS